MSSAPYYSSSQLPIHGCDSHLRGRLLPAEPYPSRPSTLTHPNSQFTPSAPVDATARAQPDELDERMRGRAPSRSRTRHSNRARRLTRHWVGAGAAQDLAGGGRRNPNTKRQLEARGAKTPTCMPGRPHKLPSAKVATSKTDAPANMRVRQTILKLLSPGTAGQNCLQNQWYFDHSKIREIDHPTDARRKLRTPTNQRRRRHVAVQCGTTRQEKSQHFRF